MQTNLETTQCSNFATAGHLGRITDVLCIPFTPVLGIVCDQHISSSFYMHTVHAHCTTLHGRGYALR